MYPRVVQVGHLFVPVLGLRAAQVRSRYEDALALDFDFCLEGVCEVRVVLVRFAPIHQEDGDGPGSRGDSGDACGVDGPYLRVERKAAAIGDVVVACPLKRYRFRVFVLLPLPHRSSLAVIVLDRHQTVVGPSDRVTLTVSEPSGTRKLKPIDDGKKPFFAALRSSVDSSARPADSGISSRLSSSSVSPLCSGGAPAGIRKPVRYQFEGRTQVVVVRADAFEIVTGVPSIGERESLEAVRWCVAEIVLHRRSEKPRPDFVGARLESAQGGARLEGEDDCGVAVYRSGGQKRQCSVLAVTGDHQHLFQAGDGKV